MAIGCDRALARKAVYLLERQEQLKWYISKGKRGGCVPITRISGEYPSRLRAKLAGEAPGSLWAKGDLTLLQGKMVSLVGSRELEEPHAEFAREVGKQAALQGYTLVSGNARGADKTAQESCLEQGGSVICVVADELEKHTPRENMLYLSEEGFDLPFSAQRALQRNRIIHSFSPMTFVAHCRLGKGGTWSGTCNNLENNFSQVLCYADGSKAAEELLCRGAMLIEMESLADFGALQTETVSFLET